MALDRGAGPGAALMATCVWRSSGRGRRPGGASARVPGPLVIATPCFQLDPQALQDRDWQRTVIAMNGVCTRGVLWAPAHPSRSAWPGACTREVGLEEGEEARGAESLHREGGREGDIPVVCGVQPAAGH